MYKIDNFNRDILIERYVTDIVGGLHFLETKEMLKDILMQQKHQLNNDELECEIMRHDPGLMTDVYVEEIMEGVGYAKNF